MKLPPPFFYNFFKENTFFVIDSTIYNISQSPCNSLIFTVGKKNFFFNENLKLSQLEELYFQNNDSELKKYGNEILKGLLLDEKEISTDYYKLEQEIELAEFVLYNILKKGKKENSVVKLLAFHENNPCLIQKLFNQDCFVRQGKIYALCKGKERLFSVRIKNQEYGLGECIALDLEELEKKYIKSIEEKIISQLTKGQGSLISKLEKLKEKKELVSIIKKGEFYNTTENKGLKITDEGFFVTTKIGPSYILYEPGNKKHYRFGEALIGIKLAKQYGNIHWSEPVVINPYIHPALPLKEAKPYQKICNGRLDYHKLIHDKSLEESINLLLGEAKRMMLSGYYGFKGAWHPLTEEQYQGLEVKNFDPREVTNRTNERL